MSERIEGIWDDISEAVKWKPILPMLKRVRETPPGPAKLAALRDAAEFFVRTSFGRDPQRMPGFQAFDLFVQLAQTDPRVAEWYGRVSWDDSFAGR